MDHKNKRWSKIKRNDLLLHLLNGLKKAGILLDRKVLAVDMALNNAEGFAKLAATAKAAL